MTTCQAQSSMRSFSILRLNAERPESQRSREGWRYNSRNPDPSGTRGSSPCATSQLHCRLCWGVREE